MDEKQDMNFTIFAHLKLECKNYDQYFLNATLLPAVCIILLLVFIQRRKKIFGFEENLWCLRGRCGFVVPVDFTSTLENRWSYAFGFGAVTQHMVSLIFGFTKPYPFVLPSYLKVFMYMMSALKVGVVCMPLFACLSTPCQLLGGVLGLLVFLDLFELIWCFDSTADKGGIRYYLPKFEWLLDLPHLLCLSFLVLRFGHLIVTEILICLKKHHRKEESEKEHYLYVQRLLQRPTEKSVKKSWFQRKVYEWDPYFKFPNRIIATVVLSFLSLYMMMLLEQVLSTYILTGAFDLWNMFSDFFSKSDFEKHLRYAKYTWYMSSACAALSSLVHISRVMVFYRKHIKSMWAGNKIYLPRKYQPSPTACLGGLLKYPGYQIAFTLWGYLIVHLAMFGAGLVFVYMVISPIQAYGFLHWLNETVVILANFLVVMAVMELQRVLIHFFFLQDKNSPTDKDKPLALNNRRAFHNLNYFLFFFNVMLGVMSCMKRLFYCTTIGLMLLPRIERAIMPQGYEKQDSSYCTWVGMLIADHHHSNPVLVCFCHLLLKHNPDCIQPEQESHLKSEARVKERVRIRWHLMYTLMRNPKLILMRKQDRQKAKDLEYAFAWAVSNSV